jgi:5-methylcytosine-specific restriction enzyme A
MPGAAPRLCHCGAVVVGRCPCRTRPRGSQRARGYDVRWEHLRDRHRAAFPLCEVCARQGRIRPMRDVDHIVPFTSLADPRRLDPANLQSLCAACHREKTRDDKRS